MAVKQISVFVENKPGRLAEITSILRDNNIDIRALTLADTTKFGILRLIVDDPDSAEKALKRAALTVSLTSVIVIGVDDRPGGLCNALNLLSANGVAVEYMYAFISREASRAFVILRVDDEEKSVEVLTEGGFRLLDQSDIDAITR